jgi:thymidylate synthase
MITIKANNVGHAFKQALSLFVGCGKESDSRNGSVIRIDEPVATVYTNPRQRVLWNKVRRPNPFFHLMEAMWMLAGRNDLRFVSLFNKRMSEYSDDRGVTQPAAYGYRWRQHFDWDQVAFVIKELRTNPQSRRCVVAMWDPNTDLKAVANGGKDVPCNTTIYFLVRPDGTLDMTVSNRSNDAIWGCYGANVVHMSFLHEYVALAAGLPLGKYVQISNDLHIYTDVFSPIDVVSMHGQQSERDVGEPQPLVFPGESMDAWLRDLHEFFHAYDNKALHDYAPKTAWFKDVVMPMYAAWTAYKNEDFNHAYMLLGQCTADDWLEAGKEWLLSSKLGQRSRRSVA